MILSLIINAIAVFVSAYLIPGVEIADFMALAVLVVVLGILNTFIKPIVKLISLPITIITLGLFSLVINALFIMLAAWIVPGFTVDGFWTALVFSIVLSLVSAFLGIFRK